MPRPPVDRSEEVKRFSGFVGAKAADRPSILLIEDSAGQGKSRLLELYAQWCDRNGTRFAHVDFKNSSLEPPTILQSIKADTRLTLPRCMSALLPREPRVAAPEIKDNTGIGYTKIEMTVTVAPAGRDEQRLRWSEATQAFFADLAAEPEALPVVLLVDTLEKSSIDTRAWLCDQVLRMAIPRRTPGFLIVLAGKELPQPSGDWASHCEQLTLRPLKLEHWQEYAVAVGSILLPQHVALLFEKHGQVALKMAEQIDMFIEDGRA